MQTKLFPLKRFATVRPFLMYGVNESRESDADDNVHDDEDDDDVEDEEDDDDEGHANVWRTNKPGETQPGGDKWVRLALICSHCTKVGAEIKTFSAE